MNTRSLLSVLSIGLLSLVQVAGLQEVARSQAVPAQQVSQSEEVDRLIKQLQSTNLEVRETAAFTLGQMRKDAIPAIPALIKALKKDPLEGGGSIVNALNEIGEPAVAALLAALKDADPIVRWRAADGLSSMREDVTLKFKDQIVPALATALKDPDADVRSTTASALGRMKEIATPAVPGLVMALKDPDVRVQLSVAWTLAEMEEAAAPTILAMITILKAAPEDEARSRAEEILSQIGEPAIPAIVTALKTPDTRVRLSVLSALGALSTTTSESPIILDNPEYSRFTRVVEGPGMDERKVPALAKTLEDQAIPALITIFKEDPDSRVRSQALWALGCMRKSATAAIPTLVAALRDPQQQVRLNAAWALGRMEEAATPAIPTLTVILQKDPDLFMQSYTAWALGQMGKSATSAIPALIASLKKESANQVRLGARKALIQIGEPTIPELITALSNPDALVRSNAADILGWIREDATDKFNFLVLSLEPDSRQQTIVTGEFRRIEKSTNAAMPELVRLLKDPNSDVRSSAAEALKKLGYQP
jgi:HEAT repeat protein